MFVLKLSGLQKEIKETINLKSVEREFAFKK